MPWPVAPREMKCTGNGIYSKEHRAFLFVMKSVEDGSYFGYDIPPVDDGHVRIIMKRGYHYF